MLIRVWRQTQLPVSDTADADAKLDGLALTDWDRAAILLEYLRNLPEPFVPRVELLPEVVVLVISMLAILNRCQLNKTWDSQNVGSRDETSFGPTISTASTASVSPPQHSAASIESKSVKPNSAAPVGSNAVSKCQTIVLGNL